MAVELRLELPPVREAVTVTPEMLAAGRAAFTRKRAMLSDLYQYFDVDRDAFITSIYRSMARLAP